MYCFLDLKSEVGLFWVYFDKKRGEYEIIYVSMPMEKAELTEGWIDPPIIHIDIWYDIIKKKIKYEQIHKDDYTDWPRGRVFFNTEMRNSIVVLPRELNCSKFKNVICNAFNLNQHMVRWEWNCVTHEMDGTPYLKYFQPKFINKYDIKIGVLNNNETFTL